MDYLCWCCCSPAWDDADDDNSQLSRTLTAVGDGECGKTSLLVRISRDTFVTQGYRPTDFDTDVVDVFCGDKKIQMVLQDSPGQESYDRLRPLAYGEVDVVLLCFSLDDPTSLVNVEDKWIQEVEHYCPKVPVILVGNKKDLRDSSNNNNSSNNSSSNNSSNNNNSSSNKNYGSTGETVPAGQGQGQGQGRGQGQRFVSSHEGKETAKRIKAKAYVECSAKDGTDCKKLLGAAVRQATMHRPYNSQSMR
ncbi:rho-related GTP-binding protein RhoA-C-like [Babylonia areolata]|uniref:rho-related GTP-binding protein RhoA-C-like n=1 Tax=Babylonia areolata TaxID=304850 RepID=UPI003FCFF5CE